MRVNANGGFYWGASLESMWTYANWSSTLRAGYPFGEIDRGNEVVAARRVPPLMGAFTLAYALSDEIWLEAKVHGAGAQGRLHPSDQKDLRICETERFSGSVLENCAGSPAWASGDVQAGWTLIDGLELLLKLQNVTDQDYRIHGSGTAQAGRSVWAMFRYRSAE